MTADTSAEFVQALADDFEKLADLIARIEAAQGPDRVLDWQIYAASKGIAWGATEQAWVRDNGARGVPPGVPAFSASLDAAASLVPEGWRWQAAGGAWSRGPHALLLSPLITSEHDFLVEAATPALALCAAALRAREARDG